MKLMFMKIVSIIHRLFFADDGYSGVLFIWPEILYCCIYLILICDGVAQVCHTLDIFLLFV